jgi:hypothetical protein
MIKNNLNNNLFKIISIVIIAVSMSLMAFSFNAFAFTITNNPNPKPVVTTSFDYKGIGAPGNTVKLTFDTGETKTGTIDASGNYKITFDYPRTIGEIQVDELNGTVVSGTKLVSYDITKFNTDSKGNIIGPVLVSGSGEVPGSTITIEFDDGEILTALVDSSGNFTAQPLFVKEAGSATSTGVVKAINYDGGITTIAATQVTPVDPTPVPTPTPTPTPTPVSTGTPTPVAAAVPAKATVRSGGELQIAGIIALFTVILAILVINKKFKR